MSGSLQEPGGHGHVSGECWGGCEHVLHVAEYHGDSSDSCGQTGVWQRGLGACQQSKH